MARARERRSRQWWSKAIARWRRSKLSAREFARREDVALSTLYWWSSELSRGTRAKRESPTPVPLEVRVDSPSSVLSAAIEVECRGVLVRLPAGTEATYVAALARALGASV